MNNLLVITDNADIQTKIKWTFSNEYSVLQALDFSSALRLFNKNLPSVVILDIRLSSDGDDVSKGLSCLRDILKETFETYIIVLASNYDKENAIKAIQIGASNFYLLPLDMSEFQVIVRNAFQLYNAQSEIKRAKSEFTVNGLIGECPEMQKVLDTINKISIANSPVLITGESGTEKEIIARGIHDKSNSNSAFISLDSSSVSSESIDSIILDQAMDAFTSTRKSDNKQFEITLFFDNVDELSKDAQLKLLNVLQDKKIIVSKGSSDLHFNVRVIASTQKNLYDEVKAGNFREDIFFRINTIDINIPPLRKRGFDINLLANMFLNKYKELNRKKIKGLSKAAINVISAYSWPGNVIELETKVQGAVLTVESSFIEPNDLGLVETTEKAPPIINKNNPYLGFSLKEARKRLEVDLIKDRLERHHGNIKRVAEDLEVSRATIYDMIEKHKLQLQEGWDKYG